LSSILRALKKLDEDSMSREQETGEEKIKMKRIVSRRVRAPRGINRLLFIVLPVLLLGAAAWIVLNLNKQPPETKKQDTSPKMPALTHFPQQVPTLKKELKKDATGELKPAAGAGEPLKYQTKPVFPESGRLQQPDSDRMGKDSQITADKTIAERTIDQKELIKETKHPEFILNGILWSAKADRRVALINDRYLKEGDTIEGVLVVKIEKAVVILKSGQETWTLRVKKK
jgi:hypothetical protein